MEPTDNKTRSRVAIFAVAALVVGIPGVAFRVLCVGRSCDAAADTTNETPFCSLPPDTRTALADGFYERRSGEIIAVTDMPVSGDSRTDDPAPPWPMASGAAPRTAVLFSGTGVAPGSDLPSDMGLDDVAPSIASLVSLERPHPEVRSGTAAEALRQPGGASPRLVVEVVWKDVTATELQGAVDRLPTVETLVAEGAGTFSAEPGSLPLDTAAMISTLGTGGLPSEHGITGTLLRNDRGALVEAWGSRSPINVIATLGDHLDELTRQRAVIGGVGTDVSDRGIIGGRWYPDHDRDPFTILPANTSPERQTAAAIRLLREQPFGQDTTVDLLGLVQSGPPQALDDGLGRLLEEARDRSDGSMVVVLTAIGTDTDDDALPADVVARRVEKATPGRYGILDGVAPGSFYLDQGELARRKLSDDVVLRSLFDLEHEGRKVFADAFPAIAITFGRYCDG